MNNKTCIIDKLSHDGRGIANIDGKVTFVSGALPNEVVSYSIQRKQNTFDDAVCLEVLQPSNLRIEPICSHYGICGGCSLQHLQHDEQIALKQKTLIEQLKHIGNLVPQNIMPPLLGPTKHYRGKARLSVKYVVKKNKVLVGFHEKKGRFVADITSCPVLTTHFSNIFDELSQLIESFSIYQHIPQIEIASGENVDALVIRHLKSFTPEDLEKIHNFAKKHNYQIFLQPQGIESLHCITKPTTSNNVEIAIQTSSSNNKINADDLLHYISSINDLKLFFKPTDFTQINATINSSMVLKALELLELNTNDIVLDLFCGIGNFTLPIATKSAKCVGVEGSFSAIEQAKYNAQQNHIDNVNFYTYDLTKDFSSQEWNNTKTIYTKILLDPPRTGALECVQQLANFKNVKKIVYISCNPATLARDCHELVHNQNYKMTKVGIIDMFPHTGHVETIAVLER